MKKILLLLGILFLVVFAPYIWSRIDTKREVRKILEQKEQIQRIPVSEGSSLQEEIDAVVAPTDSTVSVLESFLTTIPDKIPREKVLHVPFVCQNPFQNEAGWKDHDESCEEAATLQTVLYWNNEAMTAQEANTALLDMIAWQKKPEHFGEHRDLYDEDMRIFVRDYFGYQDNEVLWLPNIDANLVQRILVAGYPLIVPVSGKTINNPFYPYLGYHMLVTIGYTEKQVITNDNGTKRGEKYPYDWDIFLRLLSSRF